MSGERRAAVRPPVATLPACEPRRDKTKKWIDHSLKQEVDSTLTRAFFYSKTNLASPSNCPIEPDHLYAPAAIFRVATAKIQKQTSIYIYFMN